MADVPTSRELRLNSLLCFALTKFGKLDVKYIKDTISDFYNFGEVSIAKKQLLCDTKSLKLDSYLSRYPDRHGDGRTTREVDDILAIIQQLDESTSLQYLPRYVTDNTDRVPSIKLDDGDLRLVVNKLSKMETTVQSLQSAVHTLSSVVNKGNSRNDVIWPPLAQQRSSTTTARQQQAGASPTTAGNNPTVSVTTQQCNPASDTNADETDSDGFIRSETRKQKRRRLGSPKVVNGVSTDRPHPRQEQPSSRPSTFTSSRKPLMIGKRTAAVTTSVDGNQFKAAKPQKMVVCVDNVAESLNDIDLTNFVSGLGVRVFSCFKVKPRLTAWQRRNNIVARHSTFRLCINKADQNALLNSDMWPEDIVITRYFFKNSSQASNATEAPVNAVEDTEVATANATVIENVAMSTDCADKTEIYMDQLEQTENLVASTPLKC